MRKSSQARERYEAERGAGARILRPCREEIFISDLADFHFFAPHMKTPTCHHDIHEVPPFPLHLHDGRQYCRQSPV
jgi:hypothetical protein